MVAGKAFTPHLTVAKLSKVGRKEKAPRKLLEVRAGTCGTSRFGRRDPWLIFRCSQRRPVTPS
jgi:2'-5' RNA ligase